MKTSLSHPLRIDFLPVGTGRLGITFCPGKRQKYAMTGPWHRDLGADLDAIVAFGASHLVTLVEPDELRALHVPPDVFARACRARELVWHHLPIVDMDIPRAPFEDGWRTTGPALAQLLRAGGACVIHCKGGLGRAGTVAARLLVEMGVYSPERAMRRVREVRPGAIERAGQEAHVRSAVANPSLSG